MALRERFQERLHLYAELGYFQQKQPENGREDQKRSGLPPNRNAWNIVHIREDDGQFRCARVVDCGIRGLVVDDGGDEKPQMVPYRKMYRSRHPNFYYEEPYNFYDQRHMYIFEWGEAGDLLVEVQLNSQEPWTWHPGTVWTCHRYPFVPHHGPFGLVTVDLPTGQFKGILPGHRIRQRTVYYGRVIAGQYTKEQVILPGECCSGACDSLADEERLIENFNRNCGGMDRRQMATHITGNVLHCLGESQERRFYEPPGLPPVVCHTPKDFSYCGLRLNDLFEDPSKSSLGHDSGIFLRFPVNILNEILQQADTVQQNINRRVCAVWDFITKNFDQRMLHLRYRYSKRCCAEYPREQYLNTACMFRCWTERVRVLVITGWDGVGSTQYADELSCTSQLINHLRRERGRDPLDKVILSKMTWIISVSEISCWMKELHTELLSFSPVCKELIFRDVKLVLAYENDSLFFPFLAETIYSRKGDDQEMTVYDLWTKLENILPFVDNGDLQRVSDWIYTACDANSCGTICGISSVVFEMQHSDPRGNAPYADEWLGKNVRHVNPMKLNKLAQHALLALLRRDIMRNGAMQ